MMMIVDTAAAELPLAELCARMEEKGKDMGLSIRMQREDIFDAMHRI